MNPEQSTAQKSRAHRFIVRGRNRFLWFALFVLVFLTVISASSNNRTSSFLPQIKVSEMEKAKLRNGDIIFRKATGLGSQYILSVDKNSDYSHSGIIHKVGDRITVIQSASERTKLSAGVREEPLESFLEDIPLAAIYRLRFDPDGSADRAAQIAQTFIGTPFDANLDMANSDALYCTELVWLSYKLSGIDLMDGHYDYLNVPIVGKGYYILPSSLVNSHWLYRIMIFKAENRSGG